MHPGTIATLEELEQASWFSRVGMKKDSTTAIVLASWPEAIEHCSSPEWDDLCNEAQNQYCERLVERSMERWERWNDVVDEVKKATIPLVNRKIEAVVRAHDLPEIFAAQVHADITSILMEAEYADVYPPGFFASNGYWYVNGHFPCGWSGGVFPKGQLVIY
jgi:hypothetical protein